MRLKMISAVLFRINLPSQLQKISGSCVKEMILSPEDSDGMCLGSVIGYTYDVGIGCDHILRKKASGSALDHKALHGVHLRCIVQNLKRKPLLLKELSYAARLAEPVSKHYNRIPADLLKRHMVMSGQRMIPAHTIVLT